MNIRYRMFMPKTGVSVTLLEENLLWLRSRTVAAKGRSLSETLDDLVTAARLGAAPPAAIRSVVGTVGIASDDPGLDRADAAVTAYVNASLSRPMLVRERPPAAGASRSRKPRRG
jgi:hypothetical protein